MWWRGGDESIKLCPPPLYPGPSREDLEGQQSGRCRATPPHQGAGRWGKGRRAGSVKPCLGWGGWVSAEAEGGGAKIPPQVPAFRALAAPPSPTAAAGSAASISPF